MPLFREITNPPHSPLPLTLDQFQFPSTPWMEGMDDSEIFLGLRSTGCSPIAIPNRRAIPALPGDGWFGPLMIPQDVPIHGGCAFSVPNPKVLPAFTHQRTVKKAVLRDK